MCCPKTGGLIFIALCVHYLHDLQIKTNLYSVNTVYVWFLLSEDPTIDFVQQKYPYCYVRTVTVFIYEIA